MVTIGEIYTNVKSMLKIAQVESYNFEAKCILEHCFGIKLPMLLTNLNSQVPSQVLENIQDMVKKRQTGYPLQYIIGEWEFYGYNFKVGEGVLIPRPDTETLVDYALEKCKEKNLTSPKIVDLCSGSGCIAITLKKELPEAKVCAVELSTKAEKYLKSNAELNEVDIEILNADVLLNETANQFENIDILVCNPPYLTDSDMNSLQKEVAFEPEKALFGGRSGLRYYKTITKIWKNSIKPDGIIAYEIGIGQHHDVKKIFLDEGYTDTEYRKDLAGIIRTVSAVKR